MSCTAGQTVGPFFGFALPYPGGPELVAPGRADAIRLHGTVRDGAGDPIPDAVVELWQAGADGQPVARPGSLRRDGWTFTGWGRADTDLAGAYSFTTVRPPGAGEQPVFVAMVVFARGLLDRLFTRCYLPASDDVLLRDPLLAGLEPERRATLVATADERGYRFDIALQGESETVFLAHG